MRTMVMEVSLPRLALTKALAKVWPAAYFGPQSTLRLATLPDPPLPAPTWLRVRNNLCGICGSDLHEIFIDAGLDVAPLALPAHQRIYLGHEMVGEVVEVGASVTQVQVGARVVRWGRVNDCIARGLAPSCPACAAGRRELCAHASDPLAYEAIGGGFGDSYIAPAATLVRVPDGVSDEQAIFAEPTAVAIQAALRRLPAPGERVLVLGCGTIGFLLLQTLRLLAPDAEVTALAEFEWQADLAKQFGARHILLRGADVYQAAADLTGASLHARRRDNRMLMGGFDVVYDVVGIAATLTDALRLTRAGGTVVLVGVSLHRLRVDLTPVWYQEVNLLGAMGHGLARWQGEEISGFELALRWMRDGQLCVTPLLTHRFPLDAYREAFATAVDKRGAQSIKVAFDLRQG